ncbi:MAG: alpha/beta hydrolase [Albidovulum sp.]
MLAYRRKGNGPTLILVHGYLGGSSMWSAQVDEFCEKRDLICPDLAGFGDSAHLTAPDSIEGHARLVLDLLDELGISEFDLLGHSMGGMVVQEIARLAPDRIHSLILYGTGALGVLPGRFETIAQSRVRLLERGVHATARRIVATWFQNGEQAEGFALCQSLGEKASLQAALASLTAWENWDGRPYLSRILARTLVLWGSHDRSYDWSQPETLWRQIPNADIAVVPNCAHNVHMEKTRLFNALIADFLDFGKSE